jgi:hypothetical protein
MAVMRLIHLMAHPIAHRTIKKFCGTLSTIA